MEFLQAYAVITLMLIVIIALIIDKRQRQKQVEESRIIEMEKKSKNEFLANISHEIRTPMNGIMGATELALETEDLQKAKEYLNMIKTSSKDLLNVINDLLDYSQISANEIKIEEQQFNVRECVQRSVDAFVSKAYNKGLKVSWSIDDDIPEIIIGDGNHLRQILIHLVDNAIKFTKEGNVAVVVKKISEEKESINLEILVSDTGIGIPKDKMDIIFKGFYQIDGSYTRKHGGVGLGLSICKHLIEMMNGSISIDSNEKEGTKVTFILPYKKVIKAEQDQMDSSSSTTKENNIRILIAEDNLINQKLTQILLEKRGWKVTIANNGLKAVEAIEKEDFDLVLMDVQMPEMNGLDATQTVRQREKQSGKHTPIIAMTAYSLKGDKEKCLEVGMDAYISKPIVVSEFYSVIEEILQKNNKQICS